MAGESVTHQQILLVDDEPALLSTLAFILEDAGYQVSAAQGVGQALELLSKQLPDVIVCDLHMPEVDGFEFYRKLQGKPAWREIPFLFLTAAADRVVRLKGAVSAPTRFLEKPFEAEDLILALRRVDGAKEEA